MKKCFQAEIILNKEEPTSLLKKFNELTAQPLASLAQLGPNAQDDNQQHEDQTAVQHQLDPSLDAILKASCSFSIVTFLFWSFISIILVSKLEFITK